MISEAIILGGVAFVFTAFGSWVGFLLSRKAAREDRIADRQAQLERDKIGAYVRLMESGRELRFLARRQMAADSLYQKPPVNQDEVIRIRAEFSTARYWVNILASKSTVERVDAYHEALNKFYRTARDTPTAPQLMTLRAQAGDAQDVLEQVFRAEIGFGDQQMWYQRPDSLRV
jgi:hypothetical protein